MPALADRLGMTNQRSAGNAWASLRKKIAERDPRPDVKVTIDPKVKTGGKRGPKKDVPSSSGNANTANPGEASAAPAVDTYPRKRGRPPKAKPATAAVASASASNEVKVEQDATDAEQSDSDNEMASPPAKRTRASTAAASRGKARAAPAPKKATTGAAKTRACGAKAKGKGKATALSHKKLSGMSAPIGGFPSHVGDADDELSSAAEPDKIYDPKERDCISDLEFKDVKVEEDIELETMDEIEPAPENMKSGGGVKVEAEGEGEDQEMKDVVKNEEGDDDKAAEEQLVNGV